MCPHPGSDDFWGVGVGGFGGEKKGLYSGSGGSTQDGAEVARVTHTVEDQDKVRGGGHGAGSDWEYGEKPLWGRGVTGRLHDGVTDGDRFETPGAEPREEFFTSFPYQGGVNQSLGENPRGECFFEQTHPFDDKLPGFTAGAGTGLQFTDVLDDGVFCRSKHAVEAFRVLRRVEQELICELVDCVAVMFWIIVRVLIGVAAGPGFGDPVDFAVGFETQAEDAEPGPTAVEIQPVIFKINEPFVFHFSRAEAFLQAAVFGRGEGALEGKRDARFGQGQRFPIRGGDTVNIVVEIAGEFFGKHFNGGCVEEGKPDEPEFRKWRLGKVRLDGLDKDVGSAILWEAENTGGNGREGEGGQVEFFGALEGPVDGRAEFVVFVTAAPNRANRVEDVPGREAAPGSVGRLGVGNRTVFPDPGAALFVNDAPSPPGDDRRDPAAVHEPFVCGVDDGVHLLLGNVTLNDF